MEICKEIGTTRNFSFPPKLIFPSGDESQHTLPPVKVGPRKRAESEQSQKKDIEAINRAFKRKIGDDEYRSQRAFGRSTRNDLGTRGQDQGDRRDAQRVVCIGDRDAAPEQLMTSFDN